MFVDYGDERNKDLITTVKILLEFYLKSVLLLFLPRKQVFLNSIVALTTRHGETRKHATRRVGRAQEEQTTDFTKSTKMTRKHEKEFDKCETKDTKITEMCHSERSEESH